MSGKWNPDSGLQTSIQGTDHTFVLFIHPDCGAWPETPEGRESRHGCRNASWEISVSRENLARLFKNYKINCDVGLWGSRGIWVLICDLTAWGQICQCVGVGHTGSFIVFASRWWRSERLPPPQEDNHDTLTSQAGCASQVPSLYSSRNPSVTQITTTTTTTSPQPACGGLDVGFKRWGSLKPRRDKNASDCCAVRETAVHAARN